MIGHEHTYPLTAPTYLFVGQKPVAVLFGDERVDVKTWIQVYAVIIGRCNENPQYHERLMYLRNKAAGKVRLFLSDKADGMSKPYRIDTDLWGEVHYGSATLMHILTKQILVYTGFDISGISLVIMANDLTGQTFGRLTVIAKTDKKKHNQIVWECECECGNKCEVTTGSLRKGDTKSCGCINREFARSIGKNRSIDLTGKIFGRLTVLEKMKKRSHGQVVWKCVCECGIEHEVTSANLIKGETKSCGCLQAEHNAKVRENLIYVDNTEVHKISKRNIYSNNTTGVRGVYLIKSSNMYRAYIYFKKKKYHLGVYSKLEDAKQARLTAEEHFFGEFLEWYYENYPAKK